MHNAFKEQYPYSKVSYERYRTIFAEANIGFGAPHQDEYDSCLIYFAHLNKDNHDSENCELYFLCKAQRKVH